MRFQQNNKFNTKNKLKFIFLISLLFLIVPASLNAQKKYVVVLDAGHGGKDPGNLGNGYQEKNIALKIALLVGNNLKKNKDFTIKYTRTTDVYVDLWKRGDIANEGKADLFVSIHCDSHTSNAYGAGTFVLGLRGNKKNLEIAKRENAAILLYEKDYKKKIQRI
jgi:N-acetylmuramoyl-L-alanine amidase